ncbi:hypothetical protein AGMMS49941_09640 [Deferribacterales bacterium]|nr:hypothetical protein AGMMS49941_09640 [Deferribacterales bacterium]
MFRGGGFQACHYPNMFTELPHLGGGNRHTTGGLLPLKIPLRRLVKLGDKELLEVVNAVLFVE